MDELRERLRRMRREEPAVEPLPPDPASVPGEGLPSWLRQRLVRQGEGVPDRAGEFSLDPPARLSVMDGPLGPFAVREEHLEVSSRHGDYCLDEVFAAEARALALLAHDPELERFDPARALFLDTETTGLSGGAGTYVFLVGLGSFDARGFHFWQGFLREPGEEPALLAEVARRIAEKEFLVTFFGKSFDRHRLEDKMRCHRIAPPFEGRAHLDLYHPCRRIASAALPDRRLRTMEAALALVERDGDLSGSHAPAAWFDWLADRPHRLEGVFRHNRDDVLSLVVLAAHLGRSLVETRADGRALDGCARSRARALSRAHERAGNRVQAIAWLEHAIERERAAGGEARSLRLALADLARRERDLAKATTLLEDLARALDDAVTIEAAVELARLCTRSGDRARAGTLLATAREALELACTGESHARLARRIENALASCLRHGRGMQRGEP